MKVDKVLEPVFREYTVHWMGDISEHKLLIMQGRF